MGNKTSFSRGGGGKERKEGKDIKVGEGDNNNNQTFTKLTSNYRLSILIILLNFLIFLKKKFIEFECFLSV